VRRFIACLILLALLPARPASAGTYDVVACNAPGANGVNNSWTPSVGNWDPGPLQPEMFDIDVDCAGGLSVRSHSPEQGRAYYLASGAFRFVAPAGTAIVGVRGTRFGEVFSSSDDPNTGEPEAGDWAVFLQSPGVDIGGKFGPEQCASESTGHCVVGVEGGNSDSGSIRIAPASDVRWGIVCGGPTVQYCFVNAGPAIQNVSLARFALYGATVTLEDNSQPTAALTGTLFADGWRKPNDSVSWAAADNAGIRRGQLLVDGAEVTRLESSCDATKPVPCPNVAARAISPGPLADGRHELKLVVSDSAGNTSTVTKPVNVDGNGPSAVVSRASGKTITISVADGASGVAGGSIAVRNKRSEPFRALPTTLANGRLRAKLDRGSAARVGIAVNVSDNAGNVTAGQLSEMSLRVAGRRLRGGAASVAYSRRAVFSGTLKTRDGVALAGQAVAVEQTSRAAGSSPTVVATVTTDAKGRFTYRAPRGPSRRLRLIYAGADGLAPLTRTAQLRVRATSSIRASRATLRGGGRVTFSGRLGLRGATVPRSGKLVDLQAFDGGRWRTFATARARGSKGRWSSSYRFGGSPGRYPVRLRIRREDVFPYDLGYSRSVIVRVR
jgi:hypothetical protein